MSALSCLGFVILHKTKSVLNDGFRSIYRPSSQSVSPHSNTLFRGFEIGVGTELVQYRLILKRWIFSHSHDNLLNQIRFFLKSNSGHNRSSDQEAKFELSR